MKKVTIKQIASSMGLSRNTVAKALANSEIVSYSTRQAVLEKAKELGYSKLITSEVRTIPSESNQSVKTILVLAYSEVSVFWTEIILGISEELKEYGYRLRFNFISKEDELIMKLPIDWEDEADGVILLCVFKEPLIKRVKEKGVPMVFLDCPIDSGQYTQYGDVLVCEGKNSISKIVNHLIGQGVRDFAFIGDITYCKSVRERYEGFLAALERHDINIDKSRLFIDPMPLHYYKQSEVEQVLSNVEDMPQAIVCAADDIAHYTIRILKNRGIKVPEDVAVTGYDNMESLTHVESFLTTVNVENQLLGRRLVQQLILRMNHKEFKPELIYIGTDVIIRSSSGFITK